MILYEDYRKISGALSVQTLGNCRIYKSYSTIVAIKTETDFFVTDRKYSVTTGRHMSIIHRQEKYTSSTQKSEGELAQINYMISINWDSELGRKILEQEDLGGYSFNQIVTGKCERLTQRDLILKKIAGGPVQFPHYFELTFRDLDSERNILIRVDHGTICHGRKVLGTF